MTGFEVVVRPVVFPNIRPAPARALPTQDDPTQGFCTIRGSSGKTIELPFSWSASTSKSAPQERERRVDIVRIYQVNVDGKVDKSNFIEVESANKISMKGSPIIRSTYARVQEADNIEILDRNVIRKNPDFKG